MDKERGLKLNTRKKISNLAKIGIISTLSIFLLNKLLFLKSTAKERLYSDNGNFYNWKFGKVFYTVHGKGSPILLIHDLACDSSDYEWKKVISSFAQNHTVYTIDLIGCGRSDKPKITYTNYLYVQLISDFIKNVIKQKTQVISTGLSSSACIMACYIEPKLFENLILVNPTNTATLSMYPRSKDKFLKWLCETPILGTLLYNIRYSSTMIRKDFAKRLFNDSGNITRHYIETYAEAAHLGGSSAKYLMSSIYSRYVNININHSVKSINNAIQIIIGDNMENRDELEQLYQELNPSIEVDTISNSKHLPQLENPSSFVATCNIYLK